ncbi:MAG: tRNA pseudouridine(54/55) synthase Pus10 [Candidatus Methanomethylicia archaeon]|uniref:tRNA pseudouridine synthase Pus10 n=1 Tax=Thermoproteota archaeon TaxID=2056631 RepID=A0A523BAY9_9CREN|nr:tRNA pseudouridine(54/55) synthase Pus10 [Candidatus Methanomethylicia archaeon]TDA38103.1 MAG: tRNA pseudouridine(54/55) synthase Pus10 [Candidatus Verstraetearchaeota archaeon]
MVLDDARRMLSKYTLCDSCLGRQFGGLVKGVTNRERGRAIKLVLALEGHRELVKGGGDELLKTLINNGLFQPAANVLGLQVEGKECAICGGLMERIGEYAEGVAKALEGLDYDNFLIGVRVSGDLAEREDKIRAEFGIEFGESMRMECSREIGKEVSRITGKVVEFKKPDVVVLVEVPGPKISVRPMPLYISGRYRKLVRGIPQSKWDCVHCRGRGCEVCHGTGKIYPTSVEEIIVGPVLERTGGKSAKFHGAGREDVDAIVIGNGRPFVVEIKEPRMRRVDLKELEDEINRRAEGKVEVLGLAFSDKKTVRSLKERAKVAEKSYRALVVVDREITEGDLEKIEKSFNGCLINQYTPKRVLHRRADKLRVKKVYEMRAKKLDSNRIELLVRCQGGLYVKELISGDDGRTKPSVSEVLGAGARCLELDVISVSEVGVQ